MGKSVIAVEGPLGTERLEWVAQLYGQADAKYRDVEFLRHLFAEKPAGPALHGFALDDGRPVGHCAVVPMLARRGGEPLPCGKVEALFVEEAYRGRRAGGRPLVLEIRDRLYALAEERGIELLHAYVLPAVGRVLGLDRVTVGGRTLVAVSRPWTLESPRARAAGTALAALQGFLRAPVATFGRRREATLRAPVAEDIDLVTAPPPEAGRWTVLAEDSWDWYRASPVLRVLELPGADGCRALLQVAGTPGDPVRIVGWLPSRPGLGPALRLLGAAARVARQSGAGTLRFQPWPATPGDGTLERACRLLAFVRRSDFTTLHMRSRDPELARPEAVVPTPLLYLSF